MLRGAVEHRVRDGVAAMRLDELCRVLPDARVPEGAGAIAVRSVQSDSAAVQAGDVFFAIRGEATDGRGHAADAVARGAVAIVADGPVDVAVPLVLVDDARRALAAAAAASLGHPADRLHMVGITGTVGKTSILSMLGEILDAAAIPAGTIGSLGIHYAGFADETPNTTPGPLELQQTLAHMVDSGTRIAAMEVTSHALVQGRVHGLSFDLGIFTNLLPLEHLEYHGSFRDYAAAKRMFLNHLTPDAPLIHPVGDRAVAALARERRGPRISCGGAGGATVSVRRGPLTLDGTRITLTSRRPLPRPGAAPLPPFSLPIELSMLGRTNINNATLAAVAALCLGADAGAVSGGLARLAAPRRRLQVIRAKAPTIIDDTVGHPDSITGVFEVAARVPHRRLHVVFCIRGRRGAVINARDAEALAIWSRRVPIHDLVVTSAVDTADERNQVSPEERRAFLRALDRARVPYRHSARTDEAIGSVLQGSGAGNLVLLLGAQGMDAGAEIALRVLQSEARISSE
jgi:UDP-N-acetylmuramoyl-L-alanyl-D-glutamate--2,6-diaminopimelate ligase